MDKWPVVFPPLSVLSVDLKLELSMLIFGLAPETWQEREQSSGTRMQCLEKNNAGWGPLSGRFWPTEILNFEHGWMLFYVFFYSVVFLKPCGGFRKWWYP